MSQSDIRYGKNSNSRHHRIPTGNSRKDENIFIKSMKSPSDDDLDCRAHSSDFDVATNGTKMIYGNFIEINGLLDVNVSVRRLFISLCFNPTKPARVIPHFHDQLRKRDFFTVNPRVSYRFHVQLADNVLRKHDPSPQRAATERRPIYTARNYKHVKSYKAKRKNLNRAYKFVGRCSKVLIGIYVECALINACSSSQTRFGD